MSYRAVHAFFGHLHDFFEDFLARAATQRNVGSEADPLCTLGHRSSPLAMVRALPVVILKL